jgi:hypothetical protein
MWCGSTFGEPKKLKGGHIDKLNSKAQREEGRTNLRNLFNVEQKVRSVLKEASTRTYTPAEVKTIIQKIVGPLTSYFHALYPGRSVSKEIVKSSILAHDPSANLSNNIFIQFFSQNKEKNMNKFFQEKITDHDTLVRTCHDFITIVDDVKQSLAPQTKKMLSL